MTSASSMSGDDPLGSSNRHWQPPAQTTTGSVPGVLGAGVPGKTARKRLGTSAVLVPKPRKQPGAAVIGGPLKAGSESAGFRLVMTVLALSRTRLRHACHAEGRGFEARRPLEEKPRKSGLLLCAQKFSASPFECLARSSPRVPFQPTQSLQSNPARHNEVLALRVESCSPGLLRLARQSASGDCGLSAGVLAAGPVQTFYSLLVSASCSRGT